MRRTKLTKTNVELLERVARYTGLTKKDIAIIIELISNEIIQLTMVENKDVRFSTLGIFQGMYVKERYPHRGRYQKDPKDCRKKHVFLKVSGAVARLGREIILKERK